MPVFLLANVQQDYSQASTIAQSHRVSKLAQSIMYILTQLQKLA
jgi:hypothetical protein